ncbi:MAG: GNAT family N-acetyltransferase [candidate division Zixibacteria bacterium]|nr:GNAT family N-acetyltransferase [candidate division Zixibacteria bacterium]
MDKRFRRLTIDDYNDMLRVWAVAGLPIKPNGRDSRSMIETEIGRDHCAFLGVFDSDRMVGVTIAQYDGRRGWICRLAVDPDFRGLGLAQDLIQKGEEFLAQYGEVVVCALIEELNMPSMDLFEKAGFRCENEIKYWTRRPRADL